MVRWGDGKDLLFLTSIAHHFVRSVYVYSNRLRENSRWMDARPSNRLATMKKGFHRALHFLAHTHTRHIAGCECLPALISFPGFLRGKCRRRASHRIYDVFNPVDFYEPGVCPVDMFSSAEGVCCARHIRTRTNFQVPLYIGEKKHVFLSISIESNKKKKRYKDDDFF